MLQAQTLARPYAKALFELALQNNVFSLWSERLLLASEVVSDPQVVALVKDPRFSNAQLIALLMGIGGACFDIQTQAFFETLCKFKRILLLPEITLLYEAMRAQAERVVTVELLSAMPVEESYQRRFQEALKAKTQCEVVLHCETDEALLGGAIIRAGDWVIDGSLRGRLSKLRDAIIGFY